MKKRLVFATNNKHKLEEVRAALGSAVEICSLAEIGLEGDIPETADTLQGNALQKAQWVWQRLPQGLAVDGVFADDTGLEVDALGGAPGVYSARYAGEHCSFDDNIDKLLAALGGTANRKADFRTVICLIEDGVEHYFEGRVDGIILTERHGAEGFGYDPIFMPDGYDKTFAELGYNIKNTISHRARATKKLAEFFDAKVQMTYSAKGKGKITIPFADEEELEHIMNTLDKMKK